jgi:hypothetical protein
LDGKPFAAMVWSNHSVDAVLWTGNFGEAEAIAEIQITGGASEVLIPTGSWFRAPKGRHGFKSYE